MTSIKPLICTLNWREEKKPTHLLTLPLKNKGNWAKGTEGKNITYNGPSEKIALAFFLLKN
jgi:hypothetical protein